MPIFSIDNRPYFFFHVPKCAGSTVENYLAQRFGPLAMLDRGYLTVPPAQRWTLSSPQHVDAATLLRLFPQPFFKDSFAIVRHPVDRIISVFRFQRDVEKQLPEDTKFESWLADLPNCSHFYLDNHTRPMTDLVPPNSKAFRLEDGLARIVPWLDSLAGNTAGPREIMKENTYSAALERKGLQIGPPVQVSAAAHAIIASIYAADFERFNYSPNTTWSWEATR